MRIVAILGAVLLALISLRLLQLQGLDSRRYALQAEHQRLRTVDLAATACVLHGLAGERASGGGPLTVLGLNAQLPAVIAELLSRS